MQPRARSWTIGRKLFGRVFNGYRLVDAHRDRSTKKDMTFLIFECPDGNTLMRGLDGHWKLTDDFLREAVSTRGSQC